MSAAHVSAGEATTAALRAVALERIRTALSSQAADDTIAALCASPRGGRRIVEALERRYGAMAGECPVTAEAFAEVVRMAGAAVHAATLRGVLDGATLADTIERIGERAVRFALASPQAGLHPPLPLAVLFDRLETDGTACLKAWRDHLLLRGRHAEARSLTLAGPPGTFRRAFAPPVGRDEAVAIAQRAAAAVGSDR